MIIRQTPPNGVAVNYSASDKTDPVHNCLICGITSRVHQSLLICDECEAWQHVYQANQGAAAALRTLPAYGEVNSPNTPTAQASSLTPQIVANDGLKTL